MVSRSRGYLLRILDGVRVSNTDLRFLKSRGCLRFLDRIRPWGESKTHGIWQPFLAQDDAVYAGFLIDFCWIFGCVLDFYWIFYFCWISGFLVDFCRICWVLFDFCSIPWIWRQSKNYELLDFLASCALWKRGFRLVFARARRPALGGGAINLKNKVPTAPQGLKKCVRNQHLARVSESYQMES